MKAFFIILGVAVVVVTAVILVGIAGRPARERVSGFGVYRGYSKAAFDGSKRFSAYLEMPDGTMVAYDLFLPTKKGVLAEGRFPALFKYTPYGRAWTVIGKDGKNNMAALGVLPWYFDILIRFRSLIWGKVMDDRDMTEWLDQMIKTGYAVVVADRPGTGASFGRLIQDPDAIGKEASDVIDWIAAQTWSDGKVGMFGDSIQAQIQFQAAAAGNPHLKAILPATTWMDNYSAVVYPGGILNSAFAGLYAKLNAAFDTMATPVNGDSGVSLLEKARAERGNVAALSKAVSGVTSTAYRDAPAEDGENLWIGHQTLYPLLARINRYGVPAYLIGGWYDIYDRDDFLIYANLTVPKKLMVRPTDHAGIEAKGNDVDFAAEAARWFDYWLKGIENGIMNEAPIHYFVQGGARRWAEADRWPLPEAEPATYYLGPGHQSGIGSTGGGSLELSPAAESGAFDGYSVDYSTTTGGKSHWTALATGHRYGDMRSNDAKALTYETAPLASSLRVAGHPIFRAWIATEAADLDLFAYLEEVDGNGRSTYVTQGQLRLSHRKEGEAPFDNLGLPWRDHFLSDIIPLPRDAAFEVEFDLLPTAYVFSKGRRLRLALTGADADNFDTPVLSPPPSFRVLRDEAHPSSIVLPVDRTIRP